MYFNYAFLVEFSMQRLTKQCFVGSTKFSLAATKFYNKIKYIILTMIFIVKITMQVFECIATIQEVNGCCKLLLMFCANTSYTNWLLAPFTALLYFVSILLRLFLGLAFSGPRMYAESHWRYHTFERYYTCTYSCSKLKHQTHKKV